MMHTNAVTFLFLTAILTLAACDRDKPVTLAFVGQTSGSASDLATSGRNGVILAIEQKNAAGGINGKPVTLIVHDDQQDPAAAGQIVSELLSRKVDAIIGPMTSNMAMAMTPFANASETLLLSPTAMTPDLAGKKDNFLRVMPVTTSYAAKNARYQYHTLAHRKLAVIYDLSNKAYSESWLNEFRSVFEKMGGRIVKFQMFTSGNNVALKKAARELLAAKVDGVLIISNSVDAAAICREIRSFDTSTAIAVAEWAATENFIKFGQSAVEGVYVAQIINPVDTTERYTIFRNAYRARFGQDPGFAGMAGYDATNVVLEGVSKRIPGQSLKQVILDIGKFRGVQQEIIMDRYGDVERQSFMTIVRDGKYEMVE